MVLTSILVFDILLDCKKSRPNKKKNNSENGNMSTKRWILWAKVRNLIRFFFETAQHPPSMADADDAPFFATRPSNQP